MDISTGKATCGHSMVADFCVLAINHAKSPVADAGFQSQSCAVDGHVSAKGKARRRSTFPRQALECPRRPQLAGVTIVRYQWCRYVADSNNRYANDLRLKPGVSLSQARFALSNFCLNNFGADGQYFADVIEFCVDIAQLQEVLKTIRDEVRGRYPDRLPALVTCVRDAHDGEETALPTEAAPPPATLPTPEEPKRAARAVSAGNTVAVPVHAVPPRTAAPPQPLRGAETDPLQLAAGVSLAQARFTLSEFCLDQFGARGQQLMTAIDRCTDVAALQKVLSVIGSEVRERRRDSLPKLIDCVHEINETAD